MSYYNYNYITTSNYVRHKTGVGCVHVFVGGNLHGPKTVITSLGNTHKSKI